MIMVMSYFIDCMRMKNVRNRERVVNKSQSHSAKGDIALWTLHLERTFWGNGSLEMAYEESNVYVIDDVT